MSALTAVAVASHLRAVNEIAKSLANLERRLEPLDNLERLDDVVRRLEAIERALERHTDKVAR